MPYEENNLTFCECPCDCSNKAVTEERCTFCLKNHRGTL